MTYLVNFNSEQRKAQAQQISSKLYPNGEFTCGRKPQERKTEKEKKYDEIHALQSVHYEEYVFYRHETVEKELWKPYDIFCKEAEPIGSSYLPICHTDQPKKPRKQRGLNGISSYQRKILRNAAWLMQKKYGKRRLAMMTLTLPTLTQQQADMLLTHKRGWSDLVRKITQEIQREMKRQNAPTMYVGCTEIQEKRWRRTRVLAPHLHLLYIAHSGDYKYYINADKLREIWRRLIQNMVDDLGLPIRIDTKAGIDMSMVKKDAVKYIAKYLSKGGKLMEELKKEDKNERIPRAWAHCSKKLKKYILESMSTLTDDEKIAIFNGYPLEEEGYLKWLYGIDVFIGGELVRVGYAGELMEPRHIINEHIWEK